MKLNQLIALVGGKKARVKESTTKAYHILQKETLFDGLQRTYHPNNDEGDTFPDESQRIQQHVTPLVHDTCEGIGDLIDLVVTQDMRNREANGNIIIDGTVVMSNVPVTSLLYLEKTFTDFKTFVSSIPTLDPTEEWKLSDQTGNYETESRDTHKMKKVYKTHVAHPPTKEHPAQVQTYSEDVPIGIWRQRKFSARWTEAKKTELMEKTQLLVDAIKTAREEANCLEFNDTLKISKGIFEYLGI